MSLNAESIRVLLRTLPFELTDSQKKVVNEILTDLRQPYCMNRLLQGDVGSGKTVVAAIALFAAVKAGHQGALNGADGNFSGAAYALSAEALCAAWASK